MRVLLRHVLVRAAFCGALPFLGAAVASAQIFVSTGVSAGLRMYYPGSNDWWLDPSQGRFDVRVNGGGTPLMTILSGGNVGIGTASPQGALDVMASPAQEYIRDASGVVRLLTSAGVNYIESGATIATDSRADLRFTSMLGATPMLSIQGATGNVGIGTTAPQTLLDVSGAAQFGSGVLKSTFTATPGPTAYALQLSSGITIAGGGPVALASGGFIKFGDGSVQTTAGGGGVNASSSAATALSGTNASTSYSVCLGTVTITPQGSTVTVKIEGSIVAASATRAWVGILQNGQFIGAENSTTGISACTAGGANYECSLTVERTINGLTPNTQYSFCAAFANDTPATVTIPSTHSDKFMLYVREEVLK